MHSASNGGCSMTRKYAATAGVLLLLGVSFVSAQVSTSSITGAVTDSSGAMVVNAKIEAKNDDNGVVFEQHTTGAGTYTFSSLTPGSYSTAVTMAGFRTFTSTHNILTVGTPLVVDVTLKVGAVGESVEVVESNYQRLETSNATVSDVMDTKQVQDLPLNGRNPLALLTLEPGVVQRTTNGAGSGTHVFGSRDRAHNVTIDGIDANESTVPNPQGNIQRLNPDNVGIALFRAPTVYTPPARNGMFRFVRGAINVGGTTVTGNSPLLVDASGNLKPGVPVCAARPSLGTAWTPITFSRTIPRESEE